MSWPRAVATVGGIGRLPLAPGSWASAAAIPLAWGLHWLGGFWLMGPATVAIAVLGWVATARYLRSPDDDPPEVVIDEVAGMMVALWPLSAGLTWLGAAPHVWPWPGWVVGFLLFRALDIFKPPPVGWADRQGGATGVMLDDLLAGLMAALVTAVAGWVAHGGF